MTDKEHYLGALIEIKTCIDLIKE